VVGDGYWGPKLARNFADIEGAQQGSASPRPCRK
jgi:hypothetical protein